MAVVDLIEGDRLDRPIEILKRHEGEWPPFPICQLLDRGNDSDHPDGGSVGEILQTLRLKAVAGEELDIFPVFVQRVSAQVESDQLPLTIQPHDGGPGLALPQLRFINTRSPSRTPTKERGLVLSLLLLPPCRTAERSEERRVGHAERTRW